ncbi:MAG: hypothetical protein LBD23_14430 [Oscillospiraceae bacterium]|nr:hypothetical protein [Oscillospiraceae bacterium]
MKRLYVLTCIALFLFCLSGCSNNWSTIKNNNAAFSEAVKAINADTVTLNELTAFEWDTMYTFAPFTPKKAIEEVIGFSSSDIQATINESQSQLIFVKDNKVVCSIYGYGNSLGYWFSFRDYLSDYLAVTPDDIVIFSVDYSGVELFLSYIQE